LDIGIDISIGSRSSLLLRLDPHVTRRSFALLCLDATKGNVLGFFTRGDIRSDARSTDDRVADPSKVGLNISEKSGELRLNDT